MIFIITIHLISATAAVTGVAVVATAAACLVAVCWLDVARWLVARSLEAACSWVDPTCTETAAAPAAVLALAP